MGRKWTKIVWTDWALVDDEGKIIGDNPEYYPGWIKCPSCKQPMPYYGEGTSDDYFECLICGRRKNTSELTDDDYTDDDGMPACCKNCGGPYPDCMTSCKIFDD